MSCPTRPHAHAAKLSAFLLFVVVALLVAGAGADGQPPDPKTPGKADVKELKLRWETEPKKKLDNPVLYFDLDGLTLVLTGRQQIEAQAFNARTGKPGFELPVPADNRASNMWQFRLEKGKFAFQNGNSGLKELVVWDSTNGKASRMPIPAVSPSIQSLSISPNGRFMSASAWRDPGPREPAETPCRVFDAKTNKAVVSFDWPTGTVAFTADSSRVLSVDATDRFRWFKLPSGQAEGEWKFERDAKRTHPNFLGMSADGGVILYYGRPPKGEQGLHLLNGKTGDVLHSFPQGYTDQVGFISPDGGSVALIRNDGFGAGHTLELLDAKGTLLGKLAISARGQLQLLAAVAVSWEARALATYHYETNKLSVYDLPGASGAVAIRPKGREPEAANRAPVPTDAAVARAEAAVRQVLKDEYAKKSAAEKKALAQKLIKLAEETADDAAARYVMLRDARDLAEGVADPALALQAVDGLAKWYQVEASAQQMATLEKILAATANPAAVKVIAETAGDAAQAAADDDEFDEAVQFAQLAANAVRKGKLGAAALEEADYNLARAKKARDAFAAIRPALEKVKAEPDDPGANTIVGKYRCFGQNKWDEGLKYLTKGGDPALRAVAELDLKTPRTGVPEDAKVADAWWEYAQTAPADVLWAAQARTRYWYGRCIPGLTGLNKARAETRLAFTAGGVEYRPGLVCELSAKQPAVLKGKKARLDAVLDFSGGEFTDGTKTTDLTVKWTGALVPPRAGRYTLGAQTNDPVRVRVDGKIVIDTTAGGAGKKEAAVVLGERAAPIVVEFSAPNTDRHKIRLAWVVPGGSGEESIPSEHLFHDRKAEAVLGK
jgi:hypothetical protein